MEQDYTEFGPNFVTQHFEDARVRSTASDKINTFNNLREDIDECFLGQSYLWIMQWVNVAWGATCFTNARNTERIPIIDGAPSMQMPTNFAHSSSLSAKKFSNIPKTSSPRVVEINGSENRQFSFTESPFMYRTYTSNCSQEATSVDSSNWSAKYGLAFTSATTCSKMSSLTYEIRLRTVVSESDI